MRRSPSVALAIALLATDAAAHTGEAAGGGFATGFLHPVLGWDHVAAMVAVGLWGAFLRPPAIWLLPVVFPLVMAIGGALGVAGVPIPGIEVGIAASALIVGAAVLLAWRPPLVVPDALHCRQPVLSQVGVGGGRARSSQPDIPGRRAPGAAARLRHQALPGSLDHLIPAEAMPVVMKRCRKTNTSTTGIIVTTVIARM